MTDDRKPLIEGIRPDETPLQAAHRMLDDAGIRDGAIDVRVASACALLDERRRRAASASDLASGPRPFRMSCRDLADRLARLIAEVGTRGGARVALVSMAGATDLYARQVGGAWYHQGVTLQELADAVARDPDEAHVAILRLDYAMAQDWLPVEELHTASAIALPTMLAERIDAECRSRIHSTVLVLAADDGRLRRQIRDALNDLNPGLVQEVEA